VGQVVELIGTSFFSLNSNVIWINELLLLSTTNYADKRITVTEYNELRG